MFQNNKDGRFAVLKIKTVVLFQCLKKIKFSKSERKTVLLLLS